MMNLLLKDIFLRYFIKSGNKNEKINVLKHPIALSLQIRTPFTARINPFSPRNLPNDSELCEDNK